MIIRELEDGLKIRRLHTPEDINIWRAGFVGAYQSVFSGAPYHERFYPSEAEGVYRTLTRSKDHITLVATRGATQVVGFGCAIPLKDKPSVAQELVGLVPSRHCFYMAELGVVEQYRRNGLGRVLIDERLKLIDRAKYSHVILRISAANRAPSLDLYESYGFEDMGVHMDVNAMRTDGRVRTDRRLFMHCVLSQVSEEVSLRDASLA